MATRRKATVEIPVDTSFNLVSMTDLTRTLMTEYAAKVNMDRAIPDYRDGLKPVQRKLMFTTYRLESLQLLYVSLPLLSWLSCVSGK